MNNNQRTYLGFDLSTQQVWLFILQDKLELATCQLDSHQLHPLSIYTLFLLSFLSLRLRITCHSSFLQWKRTRGELMIDYRPLIQSKLLPTSNNDILLFFVPLSFILFLLSLLIVFLILFLSSCVTIVVKWWWWILVPFYMKIDENILLLPHLLFLVHPFSSPLFHRILSSSLPTSNYLIIRDENRLSYHVVSSTHLDGKYTSHDTHQTNEWTNNKHHHHFHLSVSLASS